MELWHVDLGIDAGCAARLASLLAPDEQARAQRLRGELNFTRFVAARVTLRKILAAHTGTAPHALRFAYGAAGKPSLEAEADAATPAVPFSMSHSGHRALIAVGGERPMGVDIELLEHAQERAADLRHVFTATECAEIDNMPPSQQALASYRCWVRKEALLKAIGCGFTQGADLVSVSTGERAGLLCSTHPDIDPAEWSLMPLEEPGVWTGALAVCGPLPRVTTHHWEWRE